MRALINRFVNRFLTSEDKQQEVGMSTLPFDANTGGRSQRRNNRETTEYHIGDELSGFITGIEHFGVFVRLPNGESGLVFKHEVTWPGEDITYGVDDKVSVLVTGFKAGRGLSLSIRQTRSHKAFGDFVASHKVGDSVIGTVKSIVGYGIFVTLRPGVFGLLHVSSVPDIKAYNRDSIGRPISVRLLDINPDGKRITLEMA